MTGLFTSSEVLIMSNKITTDKLRRTTESAFQGFTEVIRSNLHIVITWNTARADVFSIKSYFNYPKQYDTRFVIEENWQNLFHFVVRNCTYIDVYQLWNKDSYSQIALKYWADVQLLKMSSMNSSDLEALSYLAAHIHLTSSYIYQEYFPAHRQQITGTPGDFVMCLQNAFTIYKDMKKQEEVSAISS